MSVGVYQYVRVSVRFTFSNLNCIMSERKTRRRIYGSDLDSLLLPFFGASREPLLRDQCREGVRGPPHYLLPSPALGECRHRSLARRCIPVSWRAILVMFKRL